MPFFA